MFNFLVVLITPIAFDSIGYYTYAVFAGINFLLVPVCYFLYPETAGRSLEEIDDIVSFSHNFNCALLQPRRLDSITLNSDPTN